MNSFGEMKELNNMVVDGTQRAPRIDLNKVTGELVLSGKSIPENAAKVYEPVLEWITAYINTPCEITNFRLKLDYFNTASTIWIAKIIKVLSKINKPDDVLFIHLYVDLDDSESIDEDEVRDVIGSLTDNIVESSLSMGIKVHAVDEAGRIVKESLVFI